MLPIVVLLVGTLSTVKQGQVKHILQEDTDYPDLRKFMCGMSPNYIHSMDASHMALVISNWSGSFGAVHDSFSTHASDVDDLLELTKDTFISMYDIDNYFDFISDNVTLGQDDVDKPQLGQLNIGGINDSEYFFS